MADTIKYWHSGSCLLSNVGTTSQKWWGVKMAKGRIWRKSGWEGLEIEETADLPTWLISKEVRTWPLNITTLKDGSWNRFTAQTRHHMQILKTHMCMPDQCAPPLFENLPNPSRHSSRSWAQFLPDSSERLLGWDFNRHGQPKKKEKKTPNPGPLYVLLSVATQQK